MRALWAWPMLAAAGCSATVSSCQRIAVDFCRSTGYNYTSTPNLVGHDTQADADFTLQTFSPLVQYGCSTQLVFFLCSVYVPMCNEKVPIPIGPCRGLCESVKTRCYPVLQGFGFPWPTALDCGRFPALNNHQTMCMEGPGEMVAGSSVAAARPAVHVVPSSPCSQYARPALYHPVQADCLQLCHADVLFTQKDKEIAQSWIVVMSPLCFIGTLLALMSLLGDPARLPYPQRPLAFLALCYNLVAAGWGLRATLGRDPVACYPAPSPPDILLVQAGLGHAHCALVFFFTYYFSNAVALWWLMLMASRYLGWSHERILPHAPLFHLASWGIPAALSISVLVLRYVDADELTGMCSVGNHNKKALLALVVVPQGLCLVVGVMLATVAGLKGQVLPTLLYLLPSGATVAANCYQLWGYDMWVLRLAPSPTPQQQPHALVWVFLLRSLLNLAVGTAVAIWILSSVRQQTWWSVLCPIGGGDYKKPVPAGTNPIVKLQAKSLYYYDQPRVPRIHRSHRKHKAKDGDETLV